MLTIRPLHAEDIPQVKHIIHTVACGIFGFDGSLEDSVRHFLGLGIFSDLDDFQISMEISLTQSPPPTSPFR